MFNLLKAWLEVIKLSPSRSTYSDVNEFFRTQTLMSLMDVNFFDYLNHPRTLQDILTHFSWVDDDYLSLILDTLNDDNILTRTDNYYQFELPKIRLNEIRPRVFNDSIIDLLSLYAESIPERLKGKYLEFSGGFNLFNWDDTLSSKMYEQIRRAAFKYVDPLKKPGKFLDIGSGNGWGTAAIWSYHKQRNLFHPDCKTQIFGIEPDQGLLRISQEEFGDMVKKHNGTTEKSLTTYSEYFPRFSWGTITDIPFEDNSLDYVYISQVIHWTNPIKALQEMYRVLKPGGVAFGTESLIPNANQYMNILIKVIEGAYGFFTEEKFGKWAKKIGFRKIAFATPVTIFKFTK